MGLTEADAKALVSEGVLSADYDEHKEAIEFFDKALKIIETGEIYLNKGISLVELEKYDDAVTCYDKAATIDANDSLIWYNRGVALTQLEKYEDAILSYEKAIEISPGYGDAWYNKAELLKHKGQDAEAETCFIKVKELEGE